MALQIALTHIGYIFHFCFCCYVITKSCMLGKISNDDNPFCSWEITLEFIPAPLTWLKHILLLYWIAVTENCALIKVLLFLPSKLTNHIWYGCQTFWRLGKFISKLFLKYILVFVVYVHLGKAKHCFAINMYTSKSR